MILVGVLMLVIGLVIIAKAGGAKTPTVTLGTGNGTASVPTSAPPKKGVVKDAEGAGEDAAEGAVVAA